MWVACMTGLSILSRDKYQRLVHSKKYWTFWVINWLIDVFSCNNCVNMHICKTLKRANGTNLEGWLEQRRSMSLVQIGETPYRWWTSVLVMIKWERQSSQLQGHNTELKSKQREVRKTRHDYKCCWKETDVSWTKH